MIAAILRVGYESGMIYSRRRVKSWSGNYCKSYPGKWPWSGIWCGPEYWRRLEDDNTSCAGPWPAPAPLSWSYP